MTARPVQAAIDFADKPEVRAISRAAMLFTTFIAAPVIYWMISNMLEVNTTLQGIIIIQKQQQDQVAIMTQTQAKLLDVSATESQSRSSQNAALSVQVENLKDMAGRIDEHVSRLDDRINAMYRDTNKR